MITDIDGFASENGISQLADGTYRLVETTYSGVDTGSTAILKEIEVLATMELVACDLLVVLPGGGVLFRDFMKVPNGDWRDSYGRCADSLGDLLPPELSDFRKVTSGVVVVEISNNTIFPVASTDAASGI